MNGDVFINSKNIVSSPAQKENNFFVQQEAAESAVTPTYQQVKHLNDYDYNILQEDAYKDVNDKIFRLEYKISKLEKEIADLNIQIQAAYDISDYDKVNELVAAKKELQNQLDIANKKYKEAGISAKLSGKILTINGEKNIFKYAFNTIKEAIVSILPSGVTATAEFKDSLKRLKSISKSVDELMTMETPYGEASAKYEQLSKYIARANSIQAEISKFIK